MTWIQKVVDWLTDGKVFQGLVVAGLVKVVTLGFGIQEQVLETHHRLEIISQDLSVLQEEVSDLNRISAAAQVHNQYILARLDKLESKKT